MSNFFSVERYHSTNDTKANNVTLCSAKSTSSVKAKATKKRAFPHEEENATESLPDATTIAATGKKPSKRPRSSTVVLADVDGSSPLSLRRPLLFYSDNDIFHCVHKCR